MEAWSHREQKVPCVGLSASEWMGMLDGKLKRSWNMSRTCVDSWVPLSMKPSVQPVSTAMTDSVSSPFLLQKLLIFRLVLPFTVTWREALNRSHIVFPSSPGTNELCSDRASSSPLGKRSSSITLQNFLVVFLCVCVRLAGWQTCVSQRRANLFHWGIKSSRSDQSQRQRCRPTAGRLQTYRL